MSEQFKITIEPCNDGKQGLNITAGRKQLPMMLDLGSCNPLSELAELVIELYFFYEQQGAGSELQPLYLFWDGDAGQYTWSFTPQADKNIQLAITFCPDNGGQPVPYLQDELKLAVTVSLNSLRQALFVAMKQLLTRYSIIGYRQDCEKRDFPVALFLQLTRLDSNRVDDDISFADDLRQLNNLFSS